MKNTKILGNKGEDLACEYLENKGYEILARNFATKMGEVDVIARQGDEIVLVEVKAKSSADFVDPWVKVNKRKMERIWKTGQAYLLEKDLGDSPVRLDVVSIVLGDGKPEIEHFEDIFGVSLR